MFLWQGLFSGAVLVLGKVYHTVSCCNQGILANCSPYFTNLSVLARTLFSFAVAVTSQKMVVVEEMQFFKSTRLSKPRCLFLCRPILVALFLWFQFLAWFDPPRRCDSLLPHAAALKALLGLRGRCIHGVSQPKPALGNDVDPLSSSQIITPPVVGRWLKNFRYEKWWKERCLPTRQLRLYKTQQWLGGLPKRNIYSLSKRLRFQDPFFLFNQSRIQMPEKNTPQNRFMYVFLSGPFKLWETRGDFVT